MVARIPLIVNPSANQIQELPTGDSINIPGDLNVTGNITSSGGGFYVADLWSISSLTLSGSSAGVHQYLAASDLSRVSASSNVTSVTGDPGIFSFPSTGMYRIDWVNSFISNECQFVIEKTSDNGGTWSNLFASNSSALYNNSFIEYFNCTDTANDKLRFYIEITTSPNPVTIDPGPRIALQKLN